MNPLFSDKPGRRERHLKRKFKNRLFTEDARRVDQAMVNQAREQDEQELLAFSEAYQQVLKTISELSGNVDSQIILDLKDRIDRLYEQVCGLGGNRSQERDGLTRLHRVISQAIREGASADPQALAKLDEEAQAHELHWRLLDQAIVADLLYPDSPINPDEMIPALLSQDADAFAEAVTIFDDAQRQVVLVHARKLLEGTEEDRALDGARERVRYLEQLATDDPGETPAH
jgi:hypothetical protein